MAEKQESPKLVEGKRRGGRHSKLTPERIEKIASEVRLHNSVRVACAKSGIGERTYYHWQEAASQGRGNALQRELLSAVEVARADFESAQVQSIKNAGARGTWQASAWLLERTIPERYARRNKTEVTHVDSGEKPVRAIFELYDPEQIKTARAPGTEPDGSSESGGVKCKSR